jgi:hypothetical protein
MVDAVERQAGAVFGDFPGASHLFERAHLLLGLKCHFSRILDSKLVHLACGERREKSWTAQGNKSVDQINRDRQIVSCCRKGIGRKISQPSRDAREGRLSLVGRQRRETRQTSLDGGDIVLFGCEEGGREALRTYA